MIYNKEDLISIKKSMMSDYICRALTKDLEILINNFLETTEDLNKQLDFYKDNANKLPQNCKCLSLDRYYNRCQDFCDIKICPKQQINRA